MGLDATFHLSNAMSVLPPKADIPQRRLDVCFVPKADTKPNGQRLQLWPAVIRQCQLIDNVSPKHELR
jgi:hypothetical protein